MTMDEEHFVQALRYVSLNPFRARLVPRDANRPWSSTRALVDRTDDHVVTLALALGCVGDY